MSGAGGLRSDSMATAPVGESPHRADALEKLTGAALYVDDIPCEGAWHGRTLRSDIARGVLLEIRRDPGFDWTRVTVVTAEDVPGRNEIKLLLGDQPALVPVGGEIRHVAEPLALVAAPTKELATRALSHLHAVVDTERGVFDIESALSAEIRLWNEDNVFKRIEVNKGDAIEAALARCACVVEGSFATATQEQMYIEPQGVLAAFDEGGTCRVTGSLQCPFYVRAALQSLLALSAEKVVVTQAVTGGGFGGKEEYPSMIAAHAALLARAAERAVKVVYERGEDIACTPKRHPSRIRHRLGLDESGRMIAADIDVVLDGGAYLTLSPVVLSRAVLHAVGPYDVEHVRVVGRVVATNNPPFGAFRGFGAPQTLFACERQVQKAARRLGLDAMELRRRNLLRLGSLTSTGAPLASSVGSEEVLDRLEAALREPDPPPPENPLPSSAAGDPTRIRRGRGIAFVLHGSGFTGSGEEHLAGRADVALTADGRFEVRVGSTEMGQGAHTTLAQIAAAALGVDLDLVGLSEHRTDRVPDSGPTVASRTCMIVGGLVERAARDLREALLERAPPAPTDSERLAQGMALQLARSEPLVRSATYESPPEVKWDDDRYLGSAYPAYGFAACAVDVAVDLDTYEVTVERCVHVVDVGKAIHPVIVEGQIEGGTLQALGWALWEEVRLEEGRVVNARMANDIIPTSVEAPEMETHLVEEPYPRGAFGAKGVGEIPMDAPAAAVAGALEEALDIAFDELPITPEVICERWEGEP